MDISLRPDLSPKGLPPLVPRWSTMTNVVAKPGQGPPSYSTVTKSAAELKHERESMEDDRCQRSPETNDKIQDGILTV